MDKNNDVVMIELDRKRQLRYGHKALKMLVSMTGKSLEDLESGAMDLEQIEKIIYCGLLSDARENGEALSLNQMEDLLDQAPTFQHIIDRMQQAFASSFGVAEGNDQVPEKVLADGTGKKV